MGLITYQLNIVIYGFNYDKMFLMCVVLFYLTENKEK